MKTLLEFLVNKPIKNDSKNVKLTENIYKFVNTAIKDGIIYCGRKTQYYQECALKIQATKGLFITFWKNTVTLGKSEYTKNECNELIEKELTERFNKIKEGILTINITDKINLEIWKRLFNKYTNKVDVLTNPATSNKLKNNMIITGKFDNKDNIIRLLNDLTNIKKS